MKKILIMLLLGGSASLTFAIGSVESAPGLAESSPACQGIKLKMKENHRLIDVAYDKQDACTMGKLMIDNRRMFDSHPECFPKIHKKMLLATPQASTPNQ